MHSQTITVGLLKHSAGTIDDGYVLFAPINDSTTYLIDKCGYVVHKWVDTYRPGLSVYLMPNGKLLKTGIDETSPFKNGGGGGIIEILDWDSNVEWLYKLSTLTECQHHDVKYMPNGNILAIAWDKKTLDETTEAGRNPELFNKQFCSELIKELHPIGKDSAEIVWEWKIWDHLVQDFDSTKKNYDVVELHPELIDVNYDPAAKAFDWQHMNSIDYNPELDQILVSLRHFNEIWIIDHSTTKEEAATHKGGKYKKGGDLLYRWGNSQAYRHGTSEDQQLFFQHNAYWIPEGSDYAGSIMVFNNLRVINDYNYSSVDIIKPPVNSEGFYLNELPYAPTKADWSYTAPNPTDFLAVNLSSAQIINNGNVLICNGTKGEFFEIDSTKSIVWNYMNPIGMKGPIEQGKEPKMTNNVFRCTYYPADYSAFDGKDLTRKGIIENKNENSENCELFISVIENPNISDFTVYPNPTDELIKVRTELNSYLLVIKDLLGNSVIEEENASVISTKSLSNGFYLIYLIDERGNLSKNKIFIIRR